MRKIKFKTPLMLFIEWADKKLKSEAHKLLSFSEAIDKAQEFYTIESAMLKNIPIADIAKIYTIQIENKPIKPKTNDKLRKQDSNAFPKQKEKQKKPRLQR